MLTIPLFFPSASSNYIKYITWRAISPIKVNHDNIAENALCKPMIPQNESKPTI
jgi:hypothetical protein